LQNRSFTLYEGVQELIGNLKTNGLKLALVTGASHRRLTGTNKASFLNQFDVVVTGDQVSQGKPSPEPYLLGAQKLGTIISECLVIENAPMGIKSAKEAGMYCIAICSTLDKEHLSQADIILNTIGELSSLFGQ